MDDSLKSLSQIFDEKIYRIPVYQRGYAWQDSQILDFWDDVLNLLPNREHYTGMLSLKPAKKEEWEKWEDDYWILEDKGYKAFYVVDGQQRLTTFMILLNAIINCAEANEIKELCYTKIEDIKKKYIVETLPKNGFVKTYKFGYEKDNPSFMFLRSILGDKTLGQLEDTFYTQNLANADSIFNKKVNELFQKDGAEALESLFKKITQKLKFNINRIDDDFDVYVAFETMNNRGKKLSHLELLKNRLIYLTTLYPNDRFSQTEQDNLRKEINNSWAEVYKQLGLSKTGYPRDDDEYLTNHWLLYFKYTRSEGGASFDFLLNKMFTVKSVVNYLMDVKEPVEEEIVETDTDDEDNYVEEFSEPDAFDGKLEPSDIYNYVISLKTTARYWYYAFNPYDEKEGLLNDDQKQWITRLNRLGMGYFRPVIVASMINTKITEAQRTELYENIERFVFLAFRLAGYQSSYSSSQIYKIAEDLFKNKVDASELIRLLKEKTDAESMMHDVGHGFASRMKRLFDDNEGFYKWRELRYFLFEYEYKYRLTQGVKTLDWSDFTLLNKDTISIEHILPQTSKRYYWRNLYRDFNDKEVKCLTNSLGNLLPLSQRINSSLQNYDFNVKKDGTDGRRGYSEGSYSERQVAKETDWTAEKIKERGLTLLTFMEERWHFNFDSEEQKLAILGIPFINNEREHLPPLEMIQNVERDVKNDELGLTLNEFLASGITDELAYFYNEIYSKLKDNNVDFSEELRSDRVIKLVNGEGKVFALFEFRKTQINLYTKYPSFGDVALKGTTRINNGSTWYEGLDYKMSFYYEDKIAVVYPAIIDSYNQVQ